MEAVCIVELAAVLSPLYPLLSLSSWPSLGLGVNFAAVPSPALFPGPRTHLRRRPKAVDVETEGIEEGGGGVGGVVGE